MSVQRFVTVLSALLFLLAGAPTANLFAQPGNRPSSPTTTPQSGGLRPTWDQHGCVSDDPKVDNGPALSRILAEQGRSIDFAPIGKARDYYVSSTIVWRKRYGGALLGAGGYAGMIRGRNPGVTRIIWNGPPEEPMLHYWGIGGRISQLVLQGGLTGKGRAGIGLLIANDRGPTGTLITEQLSLANLDVGIKCDNEPRDLWATHLTHYNLHCHGVRIPYWVTARQSVCHTFVDAKFRLGFETIFRFDAGGPLNVYGCYIGKCDGATLLYIGRSDSGSGVYEIQGMQVDGNAKRLRMVDHGKYAHRVRISGSYSSAAGPPAEPVVLEREGASRYADVEIDCTNVHWPKRQSITPDDQR